MSTSRRWPRIRVVAGLLAAVALSPHGAAAVDTLLDATDGGVGGIQWVVEDPVARFLVIGTGFSPRGFESIAHRDPSSGQWLSDWDFVNPAVGESLYVAVPPKEFQVLHPGLR
jgi:hypothetical protein